MTVQNSFGEQSGKLHLEPYKVFTLLINYSPSWGLPLPAKKKKNSKEQRCIVGGVVGVIRRSSAVCEDLDSHEWAIKKN